MNTPNDPWRAKIGVFGARQAILKRVSTPRNWQLDETRGHVAIAAGFGNEPSKYDVGRGRIRSSPDRVMNKPAFRIEHEADGDVRAALCGVSRLWMKPRCNGAQRVWGDDHSPVAWRLRGLGAGKAPIVEIKATAVRTRRIGLST